MVSESIRASNRNTLHADSKQPDFSGIETLTLEGHHPLGMVIFFKEITMFKQFVLAILLAFISFTASAQVAGRTEMAQGGTVIGVRNVQAEIPNYGGNNNAQVIGQIAGGALGAILGAKAAQHNSTGGYILAGALGGLGSTVGGMVGSKMGSHGNTQEGVEIIVQLDTGGAVVVTQTSAGTPVSVGQKVFVIGGNRVVAAR